MRLINSKLPPEAKQIDRELREVQKQKEESVRDQNFDQAGQLREKEVELSAKIKEVLENRKESTAGDSSEVDNSCLLYTSPSPRDRTRSRMPSSA